MSVDPQPPYDDVNEAVIEDWVADTTPAERVRQVMRTTYAPVSADTVADDAHISPKTARKHLKALANEGFLAREPGERGGTRYSRSQESLLLEQASDILGRVTLEELEERIAEMKANIREFEDRYDASSPADVVVAEASNALSANAVDRETDHADLVEWRTTRRNLAFATVAMSLAAAKPVVSEAARGDRGIVDQ